MFPRAQKCSVIVNSNQWRCRQIGWTSSKKVVSNEMGVTGSGNAVHVK